MKAKKYWIYVFIIILLGACTYSFPEVEEPGIEDFGQINTEKIIAVGDGFLGGVMDGALYSNGQKNSVASIIISQFNKISETNFVQADINSENGYNFYTSNENSIYGKWKYRFSTPMQEEPKRVLTVGDKVSGFSGNRAELQDLTVPMMKMDNIDGTFQVSNPYYNRLFDSNENFINQITSKSPDLVLFWMGINDYLLYAINGGSDEKHLTSENDFKVNFENSINSILQDTDAKIVIGNLLSIIDIPYFFLHQYNFLRLTNIQKGSAQSRFAKFNAAVAASNVGKPMQDWRPMISFEDNGATLYPQPLVVIDNSLPGAFYADGTPLENYRQLTESDVALFSITDDMVEEGWGSINPLPEDFYLNESQIGIIESKVEKFNQLLVNTVEGNKGRIILVDVMEKVRKVSDTAKEDAWGLQFVEDKIYIEGVQLEGGIGFNGIFSLDGIHFNQRGNAFISNIFIEAINTNFNSKIPFVKINDYVGNGYSF